MYKHVMVLFASSFLFMIIHDKIMPNFSNHSEAPDCFKSLATKVETQIEKIYILRTEVNMKICLINSNSYVKRRNI